MRWGGCRPPGTVSQCAKKVVLKPLSGKDGTVMKDTMIGVDLAKSVFQLHAASMTGELKFRKKLSRQSFLKFMAELPPAQS
jgi:transposase